MKERELRGLIDQVKDGALSRRSFVQRMVAAGLTAPMATMMLAHHGVAMAQTASAYTPTKAGGGGPLRLLFWQAPTLLNPHFAVGTKDQEGSRLFYEPLAGWDPEGNMVAILAAEVPSRENGGLAADGMSVTWKLKQGVKWHDGKPFTADDVVFTWKYASTPETAAVTSGSYIYVVTEKVDDHTVVVKFKKPTPFWGDAFVAALGMIIPKHLFEDYIGSKSRDAPANLKPVGTGPYRFVEFKPGDIVRGERNPDYHRPNRPYFDTVELKGGGDAVSAARAVLQTGEFDYAWNTQVEDEVLLRMEQGGKGKTTITEGGDIEFIQLQTCDPWTEVDGERASLKIPHPIFTDKAVRQAIGMLVDRTSIQKFIYGRTGIATPNFLTNPKQFRSAKTTWDFNIEKAAALLEGAGWRKGSDGIRAKDGKRLKFVFQTSINAPRQKTQAIIKQACQRAGIDLELKSVVGSVFFSSDVANPDTYTKFYCDIQMFTTTMTQPDAGRFMNQYCSWEAATKENKWQGRNIVRWRNADYDKLYRQGDAELDPVKRAALFIAMNDLVIADGHVMGVVNRPKAAAVINKLKTNVSGWDNSLWLIGEWFREA